MCYLDPRVVINSRGGDVVQRHVWVEGDVGGGYWRLVEGRDELVGLDGVGVFGGGGWLV